MDDLIGKIQEALRDFDLPAWLFYGFQDLDPIATRILQFEPHLLATRRWFYLIPANGEPSKLVHRIESSILDHLPGNKTIYLEWEQLQNEVRTLLDGVSAVAMQYSENNSIPYFSLVDAGTIDLVRGCGTQVVSSGDLIQRFEAVWSPPQVEQHRAAALALTSMVQAAFDQAAAEISSQGETDEWSIQRFILDRFEKEGLLTAHPPIVAVNENSANPHYQPTEAEHSKISPDDFLLIDLWAKSNKENSVYADITWTGFHKVGRWTKWFEKASGQQAMQSSLSIEPVITWARRFTAMGSTLTTWRPTTPVWLFPVSPVPSSPESIWRGNLGSAVKSMCFSPRMDRR
jgi:hypothetical protein